MRCLSSFKIMLAVAGRLDARKGKTILNPSSANINSVTLSNLSFCILFSSYIKEKKSTLRCKRTILQPGNHNSPIRGLSQRLSREWVVSGSVPLFNPRPAHSLALWVCKKRPDPIPSHPSYPSSQLRFYLNSYKPLCYWKKIWTVEGFEFAFTAGCTRQEKGAMTCGFSSRVVGVSQGPLLSRTNQIGEHRALSKEFQIWRDSEEREA